MKKRIVSLVLSTIMVASAALGTTAFAEEGLSGSFSIFHFQEEDGAGTSKAFWNAANKFMEENPNVEIEMIFTDHDNYQEKLTALS